MPQQYTYSPIDFFFCWTPDGWYSWDKTAATKRARKERDELAKEFKNKGRSVQKFSLPHQLVRRGGIGSGHPEIDQVVTCFGLNVS